MSCCQKTFAEKRRHKRGPIFIAQVNQDASLNSSGAKCALVSRSLFGQSKPNWCTRCSYRFEALHHLVPGRKTLLPKSKTIVMLSPQSSGKTISQIPCGFEVSAELVTCCKTWDLFRLLKRKRNRGRKKKRVCWVGDVEDNIWSKRCNIMVLFNVQCKLLLHASKVGNHIQAAYKFEQMTERIHVQDRCFCWMIETEPLSLVPRAALDFSTTFGEQLRVSIGSRHVWHLQNISDLRNFFKVPQ